VTFTDFAGNKSTILRAAPPSFFNGVQTDLRGALIERAREKVAAASTAAAAAAAVPAAAPAAAPAAPGAAPAGTAAPGAAPAAAAVDTVALERAISDAIGPLTTAKKSSTPTMNYLQALVDAFRTIEPQVLLLSRTRGTPNSVTTVLNRLNSALDNQVAERTKLPKFATGGDLPPSKARAQIDTIAKRILTNLASVGIV